MKYRIKTLDQVELDHILRVLKKCKNKPTHAARILDISLKSIYNKLHKHGLYEQYKQDCNKRDYLCSGS